MSNVSDGKLFRADGPTAKQRKPKPTVLILGSKIKMGRNRRQQLETANPPLPQVNSDTAAAGKITVGLASHWTCVMVSVVYPRMVLTANVWEISTAPKPRPSEYRIHH